MTTKLIRLSDDTLVEVEIPAGQMQQISGGFADRVEKAVDAIEPTLVRTCRSILAAWAEIRTEVSVPQAEVEVDFSFDAEGNVYIAKAKAGANIKVKLILRP